MIKKIYFEEESQRVRWTQTSSDDFKYDYKYVGNASKAEFELLMELLWFMYEEDPMTYMRRLVVRMCLICCCFFLYRSRRFSPLFFVGDAQK